MLSNLSEASIWVHYFLDYGWVRCWTSWSMMVTYGFEGCCRCAVLFRVAEWWKLGNIVWCVCGWCSRDLNRFAIWKANQFFAHSSYHWGLAVHQALASISSSLDFHTNIQRNPSINETQEFPVINLGDEILSVGYAMLNWIPSHLKIKYIVEMLHVCQQRSIFFFKCFQPPHAIDSYPKNSLESLIQSKLNKITTVDPPPRRTLVTASTYNPTLV